MILSVPGEFYVYETEEMPDRDSLKSFFAELEENDVLEVRVRSSDGTEYEKFHISKVLLDHDLPFCDFSIEKSGNTFETAARIAPYHVPMPVLDKDGNCVSILKRSPTNYDHFYRYEGGLDMTFLNRYNSIVLDGLNEYSVELYKQALPRWKGKEVFLISPEWKDYLEYLPILPGVSVTLLNRFKQTGEKLVISSYSKVNPEGANIDVPADEETNLEKDRKLLYLKEGTPSNESIERYQAGVMYYDEVMLLTFLFSYVIHPGNKNPDKKFFLIDAYFVIEGLFAIWIKVFTVARYALAKGYEPIFQIVSSDDNIYSDHEGDDIWNKFFLQPKGYSLQEVHLSSYLALSPNTNALNIMRYIMDEVSCGMELNWSHGIFNQQVKAYIAERQKRFLPCPERTLGVLIRGTDYTKTHLPGHSKHVGPDKIIQKIAEVEGIWEFDSIFLSTENAELQEKQFDKMAETINMYTFFIRNKASCIRHG